MHVISHGGCTDTTRKSALEANPQRERERESERESERERESFCTGDPASILHLAFELGALPTELSPLE